VKVTEKPLDLTALVISEEQNAKRTDGTHVSHILRHIKATIAPEKGKFTDEDLNQFAIIGRLWERTLADTLFQPPRYERIGEVESDGVIGSPDCVDTEEWAVLEFKVCWKSRTAFEESQRFREYLYQTKAYCKMLGMCRARLFVFFVCGVWRPPTPMAVEYDLLFTPQELNENWRMLLGNVPTQLEK
jgi:hypothetical protein